MYTVRQADESDMQMLLQLERESWIPSMCHSQSLLSARVAAAKIFVLEMHNGVGVVGSITAQRIASVEAIYAHTWVTEDALADSQGSVLQLLRVNTLLDSAPSTAKMLPVGAILRDFCLGFAKELELTCVCAVTKTTDYCSGSTGYQDYVSEKVDSGVNFHLSRGASLQAVIPNWRPVDSANEGFGVLVQYDCDQFCGQVTRLDSIFDAFYVLSPISAQFHRHFVLQKIQGIQVKLPCGNVVRR
jgi:polyketide synthase PksN